MNPEEAKNIKQEFNVNIGYIYCLSFSNGKKYIGQTIRQWKERWKRHKSSRSCCRALHSAIEKYGYENIEFEILEYCKTKEELNQRESYYIEKFNTISPNGYNLKTEDTRIVYSLETRLKMSNSHKMRFAKLKGINVVNNKKVVTKKHINNSFYDDLGINIIPILCNIYNLSFTVSDKQFKIYFRDKNKWKDESYRNNYIEHYKKIIRTKNAKKVLFVEKDEVFSCAGEIVEKFPEYKLHKYNITQCCLNLRNHHKGFHFRYVD